MIIVADQDSPAPDVPEINTHEEFSEFINNDILRLYAHKISDARYYEGDMGALVSIREIGVLIEIFSISQAKNLL